MGKVYLVGAGCGDLDLYTLKAISCIQAADCLIYDHLVDEDVLAYTKKDCEKIYVGKQAHHHTMPQEAINQLLVDKAKTCACVVRLKGGDVYVFGRGGEEGAFLWQNQIDFEVVPGVSSATAGLAYAGIPITHRGLSGGFQVYTAQLRQQERRHFDFHKMLDDDCTYVFLMGMSCLEMIVEGFLAAGKHSQTPIAIISNASLPQQKTLTGTLETILMLFQKTPLPTPGLIVVGAVVEMRQYLNFYENKPLFGKKILVTTVGEDHTIQRQLKAAGADVTLVMTGEIAYLPVTIPEAACCFVFTSQHGVVGFMNNFLSQYHDVRALSQACLICIGEKTNQTLGNYGLQADYLSNQQTSQSLEALLHELAPALPVYVVCPQSGSHLADEKHQLKVYENQMQTIDLAPQHFDEAFFTCASSVKRLRQQAQVEISHFVSIGPKTSQAIRDCYGQDAMILEARQASKEVMVEMLLKGEK